MLFERFVLHRVVLFYPLNEQGSVLLFLIHIVLQELFKRNVLRGVNSLPVEVYGFQLFPQGLPCPLQVNVLWIELLQWLERRHLSLLPEQVVSYSLTIFVPHLGHFILKHGVPCR